MKGKVRGAGCSGGAAWRTGIQYGDEATLQKLLSSKDRWNSAAEEPLPTRPLTSCPAANPSPLQSGKENWPAQILACGSPPGSDACINTDYNPSVEQLQPGDLHCRYLCTQWGAGTCPSATGMG